MEEQRATALGAIQMYKMYGSRNYDGSNFNGMDEISGKILAILRARPEITLGREDQRGRSDERRVPKLPPDGEIKAVFQRAAR